MQTFVYGDLYRYDVEKLEWKLISSPNSPPPRSAHQAVAWKNYVYIFGNLIWLCLWYLCGFVDYTRKLMCQFFLCALGGEFTSPNQERFHHYKVKAVLPCFSLWLRKLRFDLLIFDCLEMPLLNFDLCRIFGCWTWKLISGNNLI